MIAGGQATTPVVRGQTLTAAALPAGRSGWPDPIDRILARSGSGMDKSSFSYRSATAAAASVTGNNQAQSANQDTAAAATTQPDKKPKSSCTDLFSLSLSAVIKELRFDNKSID